MRAECQDCREVWTREELNPIKDVHERVDPGEPMPEGECPKCGAVCHAIPAFDPLPERVEKEINGFAADMRLALGAIGLQDVTVSTFTQDAKWSEYRILIETDRQYEVCPIESERSTIKGIIPVLGWYASVFTYDPGVRYYPDGSGQPPSWELDEEVESAHRRDVVDWVIHKIVDDLIEVAFENRMWEEMEVLEQERRIEWSE